MSFSLYDATIPSFRQTLGAVHDLIEKAQAHCTAQSLEPAKLVGARLHHDMAPFSFQVQQTTAHSVGAIEGVRKGLYSPAMTAPPDTFAALKSAVTAALTTLDAINPDEVNSFVGRDMRFKLRDFDLPFTAENFLLSFSMPNFYFHASTAYGVLRNNGVALGKRDFLGKMRMKE